MIKLTDIACLKCGKIFHPRYHGRKFCCRSCSSSFIHAGKPCPARWKQVMLTCRTCGAPFSAHRYRARTATYCSMSCAAKARFSLRTDLSEFSPIRIRGEFATGVKRKYKRITTPDGRRIGEHRWVMEQAVGRQLESHEHVHHVNGNPIDNRLSNLLLLTNGDHQRLELQPFIEIARQRLRLAMA